MLTGLPDPQGYMTLELHEIALLSQSPRRGMQVGERRGSGYYDGTANRTFASPLMPAGLHSLELYMQRNLGLDTWQRLLLDPRRVLLACGC